MILTQSFFKFVALLWMISISSCNGLIRPPFRQLSFRHTSYVSGAIAAVSVRGGGDEEDSLKDCGGVVSSLFGNTRIPATLIAGASLGSAFALPLSPSDNMKLGMLKRVYSLLMMNAMSSMLLVVLVSTIVMNDIVLAPQARFSRNAFEYIDHHYKLEWHLVKTHFLWGNMGFVVGSALRGYVALGCPVIGRTVLGMLSSITIISFGLFLEREKKQTGQTFSKSVIESVQLNFNKTKESPLYGIASITWMLSVAYLVSKLPHMYRYLGHT